MRAYPSLDDALVDALRLSRAMTYKAALAEMPYGGGKAVILGDPARDKSRRAAGRVRPAPCDAPRRPLPHRLRHGPRRRATCRSWPGFAPNIASHAPAGPRSTPRAWPRWACSPASRRPRRGSAGDGRAARRACRASARSARGSPASSREARRAPHARPTSTLARVGGAWPRSWAPRPWTPDAIYDVRGGRLLAQRRGRRPQRRHRRRACAARAVVGGGQRAAPGFAPRRRAARARDPLRSGLRRERGRPAEPAVRDEASATRPAWRSACARSARAWPRSGSGRDAEGLPPHRVADRMVEERLRRRARSASMKS